jgi:AmmeMemoRadiSam system protein B/AmmeMemoRadiSam system protein A
MKDSAMDLATRRPAVAGTFYAADPRVLSADIAAYLDEARSSGREDRRAPKMLLVPHAGYVYSGPVAAHAYAQLAAGRGHIRRVVLLGPTHRVALRAIAVPTVEAFETPLGRVALDRAAIDSLADLPQVVAHDGAHAAEHALEVQLPFLQAVLGEFLLVPLAVGHVAPKDVATVIERLWGGDETLIVISSDLSHYLPYAQAKAVDGETVRHVLELDPNLAHDQACGATPLSAALMAARAHGLKPRLLDLRNSGDTAGDRSRVVGYCAMAFEAGAEQARGADAEDDAHDPLEDPALGDALTSRARNAIASALGLPMGHEPGHAALAQPGATFVTLRRSSALRGCIGSLEARRLLEHDVRHNAHAAAFRDPRFGPVSEHEVSSLEIEVSLLGNMMPISVRSEAEALQCLRPGVDGVLLEWRGHRATFLPQVWEELPRPAAFLGALKRKAGLGAGFWAAELRLSRYRVRKFREGVLP